MAARPQLPGMRRFLWLRVVSMRTGILTGIYMSCVFAAWLIVANFVPRLYPYAEIRNVLAGVAMALISAIPMLRFRNKPGRLFVAGLTAWTVLTVAYLAAEIRFTLLESRMGAFHVFMLGTVSYGFLAVLDWVFLMCAVVRQQHMVRSGESTQSSGRPHSH